MTISRIDIHEYVPVENPYPKWDYYNPITITWGELRDEGFIDWTDEKFAWDFYDEEQKARLEKKMDGRFWVREISDIPPERWRIQFIEALNEAMTTAKIMYKILEDQPNALIQSDEYHKSRSIGSDFPATLLNGSSGDYASDGRDYEYETIKNGDMLTAMANLQQFRHPDLFVLDQLERCFSSLVSLNVNGF